MNLSSASTLTREQSRRVDTIAIEKYGFPGIVLMENAGRGLAEHIFKLTPPESSITVCICCGRGNNAGDGLVLARYLHNCGYQPEVCFWHDPFSLRGDVEIFFNVALNMRIPVNIFSTDVEPKALGGCRASFAEILEDSAWIIDALLGTGMQGAPREPFASVIMQINAVKDSYGDRKKVLAVDIPSGLDADSGRPNIPTIRADHTCTFVSQKSGFTADEAALYLGEIEVIDIGIPKMVVEEARAGQSRQSQ